MEVSDERGAGVVYKIANSSVVKKIKGIKNIRLIAAIFIIAVAILIYSTVAAADSVGTASQTEQSASMDDEESRLAAILGGLDGVGEVEVMMTRRDDEIVGVLVLAEGAEDIAVMLRILSATTTAMGVDKGIVDVYAMK